ncbi:MAG: aspartate carbamoyltransferase regulatory subunit [Oscillospiraceae bacterium]|nr:aspartate carbamoyltransferase regulatory subunit [Oscillospiraceae bacterium]
MNIDSIHNGLVLDHIKAGRGMQIYNTLRLDDLDCTVAIIKNVKSAKMGKKDIIKIDEAIDLDLDVLGFLDQDITVNVIREGKLVCKRRLCLPRELVNVIRCKNPRCITTVEQGADQIFRLVEGDAPVYRCAYCETAYAPGK